MSEPLSLSPQIEHLTQSINQILSKLNNKDDWEERFSGLQLLSALFAEDISMPYNIREKQSCSDKNLNGDENQSVEIQKVSDNNNSSSTTTSVLASAAISAIAAIRIPLINQIQDVRSQICKAASVCVITLAQSTRYNTSVFESCSDYFLQSLFAVSSSAPLSMSSVDNDNSFSKGPSSISSSSLSLLFPSLSTMCVRNSSSMFNSSNRFSVAVEALAAVAATGALSRSAIDTYLTFCSHKNVHGRRLSMLLLLLLLHTLDISRYFLTAKKTRVDAKSSLINEVLKVIRTALTDPSSYVRNSARLCFWAVSEIHAAAATIAYESLLPQLQKTIDDDKEKYSQWLAENATIIQKVTTTGTKDSLNFFNAIQLNDINVLHSDNSDKVEIKKIADIKSKIDNKKNSLPQAIELSKKLMPSKKKNITIEKRNLNTPLKRSVSNHSTCSTASDNSRIRSLSGSNSRSNSNVSNRSGSNSTFSSRKLNLLKLQPKLRLQDQVKQKSEPNDNKSNKISANNLQDKGIKVKTVANDNLGRSRSNTPVKPSTLFAGKKTHSINNNCNSSACTNVGNLSSIKNSKGILNSNNSSCIGNNNVIIGTPKTKRTMSAAVTAANSAKRIGLISSLPSNKRTNSIVALKGPQNSRNRDRSGSNRNLSSKNIKNSNDSNNDIEKTSIPLLKSDSEIQQQLKEKMDKLLHRNSCNSSHNDESTFTDSTEKKTNINNLNSAIKKRCNSNKTNDVDKNITSKSDVVSNLKNHSCSTINRNMKNIPQTQLSHSNMELLDLNKPQQLTNLEENYFLKNLIISIHTDEEASAVIDEIIDNIKVDDSCHEKIIDEGNCYYKECKKNNYVENPEMILDELAKLKYILSLVLSGNNCVNEHINLDNNSNGIITTAARCGKAGIINAANNEKGSSEFSHRVANLFPIYKIADLIPHIASLLHIRLCNLNCSCDGKGGENVENNINIRRIIYFKIAAMAIDVFDLLLQLVPVSCKYNDTLLYVMNSHFRNLAAPDIDLSIVNNTIKSNNKKNELDKTPVNLCANKDPKNRSKSSFSKISSNSNSFPRLLKLKDLAIAQLSKLPEIYGGEYVMKYAVKSVEDTIINENKLNCIIHPYIDDKKNNIKNLNEDTDGIFDIEIDVYGKQINSNYDDDNNSKLPFQKILNTADFRTSCCKYDQIKSQLAAVEYMLYLVQSQKSALNVEFQEKNSCHSLRTPSISRNNLMTSALYILYNCYCKVSSLISKSNVTIEKNNNNDRKCISNNNNANISFITSELSQAIVAVIVSLYVASRDIFINSMMNFASNSTICDGIANDSNNLSFLNIYDGIQKLTEKQIPHLRQDCRRAKAGDNLLQHPMPTEVSPAKYLKSFNIDRSNCKAINSPFGMLRGNSINSYGRSNSNGNKTSVNNINNNNFNFTASAASAGRSRLINRPICCKSVLMSPDNKKTNNSLVKTHIEPVETLSSSHFDPNSDNLNNYNSQNATTRGVNLITPNNCNIIPNNKEAALFIPTSSLISNSLQRRSSSITSVQMGSINTNRSNSNNDMIASPSNNTSYSDNCATNNYNGVDINKKINNESQQRQQQQCLPTGGNISQALPQFVLSLQQCESSEQKREAILGANEAIDKQPRQWSKAFPSPILPLILALSSDYNHNVRLMSIRLLHKVFIDTPYLRPVCKPLLGHVFSVINNGISDVNFPEVQREARLLLSAIINDDEDSDDENERELLYRDLLGANVSNNEKNMLNRNGRIDYNNGSYNNDINNNGGKQMPYTDVDDLLEAMIMTLEDRDHMGGFVRENKDNLYSNNVRMEGGSCNRTGDLGLESPGALAIISATSKLSKYFDSKVAPEKRFQLLQRLIPMITKSIKNSVKSEVRKNSVVTLASWYNNIKNQLLPHLTELNNAQLKLISIYCNRLSNNNSSEDGSNCGSGDFINSRSCSDSSNFLTDGSDNYSCSTRSSNSNNSKINLVLEMKRNGYAISES